MIKYSKIAGLVVAGLLFGSGSVSEGSVLFDNVLSYDAIADVLNDESVGNWYTNGGTLKASGTLANTDVVLGIVKYDSGFNGGPFSIPSDFGGKYLYGFYAFEITDDSDTGNVVLGAATGTLSIANQISGFTNWSRQDSETHATGFATAIVLVESDNELTFNGANKFGMFNAAGVTVIGTAGFDNVDDTYRLGHDSENVLDLDAFDGSYKVDIDGTATFLTSAIMPTANFELLQGYGDASGTYGDLRLTGDIQKNPTFGSNYAFGDNVDFYMNVAVPEPSAIAIWAALGLGGCGFVVRRRMRAKKA